MSLPTNVLTHLRRATPNRPVTMTEARSIAERQALTLLQFGQVEGPRVPEDLRQSPVRWWK